MHQFVTTLAVSNGALAVAATHEGSFDICLFDLQMPVVSQAMIALGTLLSLRTRTAGWPGSCKADTGFAKQCTFAHANIGTHCISCQGCRGRVHRSRLYSLPHKANPNRSIGAGYSQPPKMRLSSFATSLFYCL